MELWIATGNKHKLEEMKILFSAIPQLDCHSQGELSYFTSPPENGKSFLENARIKAKALKSVKPNTWILGEDAGLEVEALDGKPGIYSARYAGDHARDSENLAKLLKMLQIKGALNRKAQFSAVTVVYTPHGEEWVFEGVLKGEISKTPTGNQGFGYDPVFIPEGQTQSLAQLGLPYKNANSHRALAIKAFLEKLKNTV